MMLVGERCSPCSRNNVTTWTPDVSALRRVIDKSFAARDTNPYDSNVDIAWTTDQSRSRAAEVLSKNSLGWGLSPKVNTKMVGTPLVPSDGTITDRNILVYLQSMASWSSSFDGWLPGSIGYVVSSSNGNLPQDANQTTAAWFLAQGAAAAMGNAASEPGLADFVRKFPLIEVLVPNYLQGQTAVEALWKATYYPWGAVFIGDPLASPFRLVPAQTVMPGAR
jgi:uncharacterized protein (TIGR03790 family)